MLGWGEGREHRMRQLSLEADKMSLAAVGVVRGLGDSPLTRPELTPSSPSLMSLGLAHSKLANVQNNSEDRTAG